MPNLNLLALTRRTLVWYAFISKREAIENLNEVATICSREWGLIRNRLKKSHQVDITLKRRSRWKCYTIANIEEHERSTLIIIGSTFLNANCSPRKTVKEVSPNKKLQNTYKGNIARKAQCVMGGDRILRENQNVHYHNVSGLHRVTK